MHAVAMGQEAAPAQEGQERARPQRRGRRSLQVVSQNSSQTLVPATKRLAKRSIIGTRVCAPGDDGKYYSGVISAVNTPASPQQPELGGLSITPSTRYSVRFDPVPGGCRAPDSKAEYSDRDLIGPGFGSVTNTQLMPGQKVYLTYNGREIQAEVVEHRVRLDEVDVVIAPSGQEGTTSLTKRIDEVRLLESRKSARLADSDTDFARLADMGSERKRWAAQSQSQNMPEIHYTQGRKRRPSSGNESERSYNGSSASNERCGSDKTERGEKIERSGPHDMADHLSGMPRAGFMDECSAAMVLMSLSTPPKNPLPIHCQQQYGYWDGNRAAVGSPGVGGNSHSSNSSSSSWRSGTPSPPLSDEGVMSSNGMWPSSGSSTAAHQTHNQQYYQYHNPAGSSSSSPNFTFDEGIVADLDVDRHRPKRSRCEAEIDDEEEEEEEEREEEDYSSSPNGNSNSDNEVRAMTIYKCTWRDEGNRNVRCGEVGHTWEVVAEHVLRTHLNGKKTHDNEEDFYIVDEQLEPTCSPPTKSHWDMVRPRSEDPEYQKQLRLAALPTHNSQQFTAAVNTHDIIIRDVYPMASAQQGTPNKQFKASRPIQAYNASNISLLTVSLGKMPHSPRRVRGETKKCRKVYGMEHKDLWCTQCKWKKACTRFSD